MLHEIALGAIVDRAALRQRIPVENVVLGSPVSSGWRGFSFSWMKGEMDTVLQVPQPVLPACQHRGFRRLLDVPMDDFHGSNDFSLIGRLWDLQQLYLPAWT